MSSQLGKDYFLNNIHKTNNVKDKNTKKDVTVDKETLKQLQSLGLIKQTKTDV